MKKTTEYCKHVFTEDEKREIATDMAQEVSNLQQIEDAKKAVMSDYKSQIDGLQAKINNAATKINNGYEIRSTECEIIPDWDEKIWQTTRIDTGEIIKTREMTNSDLQMDMDIDEKGGDE